MQGEWEHRWFWDRIWTDADGQVFAGRQLATSEQEAFRRHADDGRFGWAVTYPDGRADIGPMFVQHRRVGDERWTAPDERARGCSREHSRVAAARTPTLDTRTPTAREDG